MMEKKRELKLKIHTFVPTKKLKEYVITWLLDAPNLSSPDSL